MNYFHYFSEIEERFVARRGSLLMLSTLDWALIETWREAGIPLEAVLRGIDDAFDKHDARRARAGARIRKVNGLAWCAQAVMQATEEMQEAAVGMQKAVPVEQRESGFESENVERFLHSCAAAITAATLPLAALEAGKHTADRLTALASEMSAQPQPLDDLDRILTVLEERLVAALTNAVPEDEIVSLRAQADREIAPYRARMQAAQLAQVQRQFVLKRLLQAYQLPRLSLFYMDHA